MRISQFSGLVLPVVKTTAQKRQSTLSAKTQSEQSSPFPSTARSSLSGGISGVEAQRSHAPSLPPVNDFIWHQKTRAPCRGGGSFVLEEYTEAYSELDSCLSRGVVICSRKGGRVGGRFPCQQGIDGFLAQRSSEQSG